MDVWIDRRTDRCLYAQISPVFYRTLSPLGPLPCLLPNCPYNVDGQGKGTADHLHLLPLGDWVPFSLFLFFLFICSSDCLPINTYSLNCSFWVLAPYVSSFLFSWAKILYRFNKFESICTNLQICSTNLNQFAQILVVKAISSYGHSLAVVISS